MANYNTLKTSIEAVIKQNGNNEITGTLLQQTLLAMVNSLGVGYQYVDIATPATDPGTPDQNVFYLASTAGTYANFGGLVLADGEIAILKYNGTWSKDSTGAASLEKVNQLGQYVDNLKYELRLFTGGYIRKTGLVLSWKNLILYSKKTGHYVWLTDGQHLYNEDNSIEIINGGKYLVSSSYISTQSTQLLNVNISFNEANYINLGISVEGNNTAGGLIDDLIDKQSLQESVGGLQESVGGLQESVGGLQESVDGIESKIEGESIPFLSQGYLNNSGVVVDTDVAKTTDFIPVSTQSRLTYSGFISAVGVCVCGYDENQDFVSVILTNGDYHNTTIEIDSDEIKYIRACSAFIPGYTSGELFKPGYDTIINSIPPSFSLKDKKVLFFGDSITMQCVTAETELEGGYIGEFTRLTGCVPYNRGVGGTTISEVADTLHWDSSLCKRVDLPANETQNTYTAGLPTSVDMVVVFAGINDWGRVEKTNVVATRTGDGTDPIDYITGARFGSFDVEDKTTWCGGVRYLLRRLKAKYPNIPIIVMLPLHTYAPSAYATWCELIYANPNDESSQISMVKTQDDNKSFVEYRDAIKYIANEYGMPVIDTFELGFTPVISQEKTAYYWEGLHPNIRGHKLLGKYLYKKVTEMMLER